ncbi:hypothetical protein D3C86_1644970 [compost metagenome]
MRGGHDVQGRVGTSVVLRWIRGNLQHRSVSRTGAVTDSLLNECRVAAVRRLADRGDTKPARPKAPCAQLPSSAGMGNT